MKVPINQKYMLTITEAAEYFGMGVKVLLLLLTSICRILPRFALIWQRIKLIGSL